MTPEERIQTIEEAMLAPDFWANKDKAQAMIKELQELKLEKEGGSKYDLLPAVLNVLAGAGGDDAEDFAAMLLRMYSRYAEIKGWQVWMLDDSKNNDGGIRSASIVISGKGAYGTLKNESGVHRLVRLSPFNAKNLRQTSFAMIEVVPQVDKVTDEDIPPEELEIQFAKSGGAGGQNVNKRETAVRIIHIPTGLSAHGSSERSQVQNKERALQVLSGKLFRLREEQRKQEVAGLSISKTTTIDWGNQIRSYVLHPYKMVKDHRTDVEIRDPERVLEGDLDELIDAERGLE